MKRRPTKLYSDFKFGLTIFFATFFLLACQSEIQSIHEQVGDIVYKKTVETVLPDLPQGQDVELDPFLATFEQLLGRSVKIPVRLGEVAGKLSQQTTKGICIKHPDTGYKGVMIDTAYYNDNIKDAPEKIEWLVFHELGHCVLDRKHYSEKVLLLNNEQGKASMMDTYILNAREVEIYRDNKSYYWQELFGLAAD